MNTLRLVRGLQLMILINSISPLHSYYWIFHVGMEGSLMEIGDVSQKIFFFLKRLAFVQINCCPYIFTKHINSHYLRWWILGWPISGHF